MLCHAVVLYGAGVSVHAGCRSLALKDYPCVPSTPLANTVHTQALRFPGTAQDWDTLHQKIVNGEPRHARLMPLSYRHHYTNSM